MSPKYKYNPLLLWFKNSETEKNFNLGRFKEDLYTLRFVLVFGVVISIAFLFVDAFRYQHDLTTIFFRGGLALALIIIGGLTFLIQEHRYQLSQLTGVLTSVLMSVVFFLYYHSIDSVAFDIFLSNSLVALIFIFSTIMGMRFRYALLLNTANLITYILYIQSINHSALGERQISQLTVIYIVGILASYLLEKEKIKSFINKSELNLKIAKVDELDKVKNKLFSVISHDLRAPIVSLKGIVSLHNKDALSDTEFKELNSGLEDELSNSSYLLDNLLAWSKTQMQGLELKKTLVDLKEELSNLHQLFSSSFKNKNILFDYVIPDGNEVLVDRETLQIVLRNILSNAIKFTPYGGEISVSATMQSNEMVAIEFSDTGIGMNSKQLEQLFTINTETLIGNTSSNGAGIGLLLVKEFVELNRGKVSVRSELDKGTTFLILLPRT